MLAEMSGGKEDYKMHAEESRIVCLKAFRSGTRGFFIFVRCCFHMV